MSERVPPDPLRREEDPSLMPHWYKMVIMYGTLMLSEEGLDRYRPGGYHPVVVGDTFKDGRYMIYNKLGYGGYSTVWLAHDKDQDRFVALKIMVSQVTDPIEIRNWKYLNEKADGELSQHYIAQIMDSFVHEGPNGSHHCLVSEFLGPSLDRFIKENNKTRTSKKVSMYDVGNIADMMQKVMKAVNFIHDAGLCHGDIQPGNIAVSLSDEFLQNGVITQEIVGFPVSDPVLSLDDKPLKEGLPARMYQSAVWPGFFISRYSIDDPTDPRHYAYDIRLYDFGQSFFHGKEPEVLVQPRIMTAPEGMLTDSFDYRVDLWSIGYMIKWLSFEDHFFTQHGGGMYGVAYSMRWFVEDLPEEWLPKLEELRLKSKASLITEESYPQPWLKGTTAIDLIKTGHDTATDRLVLLIKALMRWRPSDRVSLKDAMAMIKDLRIHWYTAPKDAEFYYGIFGENRENLEDSDPDSEGDALLRLQQGPSWPQERRKANPEEWRKACDEAWYEDRKKSVRRMRRQAKQQAVMSPIDDPLPPVDLERNGRVDWNPGPMDYDALLASVMDEECPKAPSVCPEESLQEPHDLSERLQQPGTPNSKCEHGSPKQNQREGGDETVLDSQETSHIPGLEKAEGVPTSVEPSGLDSTQDAPLISQVGLQATEMTPSPVNSHGNHDDSSSSISGSPTESPSSPERSEALTDSQTEQISVPPEIASQSDAPELQLVEDGLEVSELQKHITPTGTAPEVAEDLQPKASEASSGMTEGLEAKQAGVKRKPSRWAMLLSQLWRPWKRLRRS